jgi:hypothetical protein
MARVKYNKLVPAGSFIADYMEYSKESETPHAYDFWTAIWLLSVSIGREVVVARPHAPVYLNTFIVLVAESGVTRKSTAVRRATKFARKVAKPQHLLIESRTTPEKLEYDLAVQTLEHNTAYANIAIDEMVKFLGRERYVQGMPTLLTDLYDSPELRSGEGGTISARPSRLQRVFVNFLSASTPSWLLRAINPDVIEGGFTSRVIFVVSEEPKRSSPWPGDEDHELRERCEGHLTSIQAQASGIPQIRITDAARSRFASWYRSRVLHRDAFRASFQSREDAHVLRMAAMLSVNDGTWDIQANHITTAIRIITEAREDGASIFEGTGAGSAIIMGVDAIRDKLLAGGVNGVKQTQLTKAAQRYANAEQVRAALEIMHELGMVQRFENVQVGRGRPSTIWRATTILTGGRAIDAIVERVAQR